MPKKRLKKIIDFIPQCNVLADVGCDHGYVGLEALNRHVAQNVVFVDISAPSLQKARDNCPAQLKPNARFVCQNGLGNIFCDCAVIAGMGGLEIISVLQNAATIPHYLVLQPMRSQSELREYLQQNYAVQRDEKFFDGKFYDLIFAELSPRGCTLTADEIEFGKTNLQSPTRDFCEYLKIQQQKYTQILQQCNDTQTTQKLLTVNRILARIQEEQS